MNTREIAEEYRLAHWAGIIKARQESGLSVKAYSKSAGFHENAYYYWLRKLRKVAHGEQMSKRLNIENKSIKSLVPNGWALCEATGGADKENPLTIEIGPGRILAEQDVDPELLLKVCRVLVQL